MPQPKQGRQQRPRIDAIVSHIKKGSYDEELSTIQQAIEDRNEHRKEFVAGLVREIYGEGYSVAPEGTRLPSGSANPFIARQERREQEEIAAGVRVPGEVRPGESPHVLDPESPEGKAALGAGGSVDDDGLDSDPDFESRSPIIGGLEGIS